jgi:Ca2+-transporting ATPase
MHIAFLEMIIDPVCSLVFEAEVEEDDLMRRKPRDPNEPLFSTGMIAWSVFQGGLAFALTAAIYVVALQRGMPEDEVRALTFFALVISIVALIFVNRSLGASLKSALLRPNRALIFTLPAVAAMLAVTLLWPTARDLFRFGPLHADDLSLTAGVGFVLLVTLEALKALWRVSGRGRRRDGKKLKPGSHSI